MRTEIRIGGFGGQGVILAGIILGKAASIFDKNEAVQTQSYGPEARGGASKCEVVISDTEVDYPKVQSPDILVAMSNEALMKYIVDLKDGGTLIVDPGTTDVEDVQDFIELITKEGAEKREENVEATQVPSEPVVKEEPKVEVTAEPEIEKTIKIPTFEELQARNKTILGHYSNEYHTHRIRRTT